MKTIESKISTVHSGIETIYESDPDDDNFTNFENSGLRERRRKLHTEAEQRRRNAIKKGFDRIQEFLHPVKSKPNSAIRMNKSIILQKSISKIQKLMKLRDQRNAEYEFLDKTFLALSSFLANYEKFFQDATNDKNANSIPEHIKLMVFQMFADNLFLSFEPVATFASYDRFSSSVISWMENCCKPEQLSPLMESVLAFVFNTGVPGRQQGCPPSAQVPRFDCHVDNRSADATANPASQRSMLLDDVFSETSTDSGLDAGQVLNQRTFSFPISMSSQRAGESVELFRNSNSTSSVGNSLRPSDFVATGQLAAGGFFPHPPSTTALVGLPVVQQTPADCTLPRFSGSHATHSLKKLQFCPGEVKPRNATLFMDDPCSTPESQHCFHDDGAAAERHINTSTSTAAGNAQNELSTSIDQASTLQYL